MADCQRCMLVPDGQEWDPFGASLDPAALQCFLEEAALFQAGRRRFSDAALTVPEIGFTSDREISTQMALRRIVDDLAKGDSDLAAGIVTA